ncbi:MAG: uracil-DNA glycosylase family protein, partial [Candidatus Cybelea sp.]
KPTPEELRNCFSFLVEEFEALERRRVVIGLGAIGFNAIVRALAQQGSAFARKPIFAHGAEFDAVRDGRPVSLLATYHPSRQNTNTGKLTVAMFDAIFTRAKEILARAGGAGR